MEEKGFVKGALAGVVIGMAVLGLISVGPLISALVFQYQTSAGAGAQQGSQNVAGQSSIAIESADFATTGPPRISVTIRNVGSLPVSLGSVTIQGAPENPGFRGSIILEVSGNGRSIVLFNGPVLISPSNETNWTFSPVAAEPYQSLTKGSSLTIVFFANSTAHPTQTLKPGDVITVKATTTVGTFAVTQFTVQ